MAALSPILGSFSLAPIFRDALELLVYVAVALLPAALAVGLVYFVLTLPMRRQERARLFLELLELGLNDGQTPERAILDAASSRDPAPGARFHLLAAHLEKGLNLRDALARVPRLLPPEVVAMLRAGERLGDLRKILPACRHLLSDAVSQTRGALNYLILLVFLVTPFALAVPIAINVLVLPRFKEVYLGLLGNARLPAFSQFVFTNSAGLVSAEIAAFAIIWILLLAYAGGPRLRAWLGRLFPGVPDRVLYRFPWRRKRMQRDFSAMLAVLLDADVPEIEAVTLAAEATANAVMRRRAAGVCARLAGGTALPLAIRQIDDSGELRWRLANALKQERGFLRTLSGWHDALDARAFQLEQAAAQVLTSALVLFNGAVVACIVIGVLLLLIHVLNTAVLW